MRALMNKQIIFFVLFLLFPWHTALGQNVYVGPDKEFQQKKLKVPYAFYNDLFDTAVGFLYGVTGYPQKQSTLLATAMAGSNGSFMVFFVGRDIHPPFLERLFLDPVVSVGHFKELESYADGNPFFPDERAGSNDSDEDNFIEGDGWDNFFRLRFKYLFPIGHGRDRIVNTSVLDRGFLSSGETGATSWNPLFSGRTYVEVMPFFRRQDIDSDFLETDVKTNGFEFSLFRDNRDFIANPSEGSALRFKVTRDWQWFDSSAPYTVVSAEWDKYLSLGPSERFRQRVLAFDFWTADTPTWDDSHTEDGEEVFHRPPAYAGATLGGLWRMRAYPESRFHDKATVYYSAEYRMVPRWNPLAEISWLQRYLELAWWQWVPFVEVGRVAPSWNLDELHSDMKWDVGFGVRAMAKGLVIRIDTAVSEEGGRVSMMMSHPFQF
ncbi:MAG: hypothetical protein JRE24_07140 [Deltaproteobacteria bacterium]|nr:hypothetical protein [Deltaproteobacteria bacterium]